MLEKIFYTVLDMVGDYAVLVDENGNQISVTMFLLPDEIMVGSKLVYENFEYEIIK